jgi:hypothetical protein
VPALAAFDAAFSLSSLANAPACCAFSSWTQHQRIGVLLATRRFCVEGVFKLFISLLQLRDVLRIETCLQFEHLEAL